MRPYLVPLALVAGLATPSQAAVACYTTVDPPQTAGAQVLGSGSFTCTAPMTGMTVTVCVDVLAPRTLWSALDCETESASSPVSSVSGFVAACVQGGPTLARISVYGSNAAGHATSSSSAPVLAPGAGSCGP